MFYALLLSLLLHGLIWGGSRALTPKLSWTATPAGGSGPVYVTALKPQVVAGVKRAKSASGSSPSAAVKSLSPELAGQAGNVAPVYPIEAERAGWEGEVVLHLYCDEAGKVVDVKIAKSSGYQSLDEAARTQSLQWKFLPEQVGREATIPVQFKLD